jgi:hypothetical protein
MLSRHQAPDHSQESVVEFGGGQLEYDPTLHPKWVPMEENPRDLESILLRMLTIGDDPRVGRDTIINDVSRAMAVARDEEKT